MKLWIVDFAPMWPVPCGLVILANDYAEAEEIARRTITHTEVRSIQEHHMDESGVVFYQSGDY